MRKFAAMLAVGLIAGLLAGCNMIVSEAPWFGPDDMKSAPVLRDGVWAVNSEQECAFDDSVPSEQWPDCTELMVVRGPQLLTQQWSGHLDDKQRVVREFLAWDERRIMLANGDPMILQMEELPQSLFNDERTVPVPVQTPFSYVAVRPLRRDEAGRIIALERWVVSCGPIRPRRAGEEHSPHVTDQPYPGLRVEGENCRADSQAAVRGAAVLTERDDRALGAPPLFAHWVREGWR